MRITSESEDDIYTSLGKVDNLDFPRYLYQDSKFDTYFV